MAQGPAAVQISPVWGFLMPHHNDMLYLVDGYVGGVEASLAWQTDGSKDWHHAFHFPQWGLKTSWLNLGSPLLGQSLSAYVFVDLPLDLKRRSGLHLGIGPGYVSKPFDEEDNFQNGAIGSHLNAALTLDAYLYLLRSEKLHIRGSIGVRHFSNGAMKVPNKGANLAVAGLAFQLWQKPQVLPQREMPLEVDKPWHWYAGVSAGLKTLPPVGGPHYGVGNVFTAMQKRLNSKASFGAELGINYNSSLQKRALEKNEEAPTSVNMRAFAAAQYLFHFGHIALRLQAGSYLFPQFSEDGLIFFRYHLVYEKQRWQAFIGLKTHYAKADNGELGLAYRIK